MNKSLNSLQNDPQSVPNPNLNQPKMNVLSRKRLTFFTVRDGDKLNEKRMLSWQTLTESQKQPMYFIPSHVVLLPSNPLEYKYNK